MDLDSLFEHRTDVCDTDPDWVNALPGGGGVYALTDAEGRLVLLASSESVRRAVGYRLSPPPEASKKRADLKAVVRRIYWRRTCSPFETAFEFHRVARALMPKTYLEACAFGPAWLVHVNLSDRLPQFVPVKLLPESGNALGPFPTRAAAERFIETLQDLFDLCRYYHILQQAPHGQACAYFEMGKCPAPCDGSIPLERYREMVAEAEAFGADILRLCVRLGGVLTGEHGVGVEKRDLMPTMFSQIDLDAQQRIKCAFDDKGLLNPGKVFPQLQRCAELGRMHISGGKLPFPDIPRF